MSRPLNGNGEDVKDSIVQRTNSIVDGIKRFYNYSGETSRNDLNSRRVQDSLIQEEPEMELNRNSGDSSNENIAAAGLYILNRLVNDMGFPKQMVKNILIYDKDLIGDDIMKAIDFCVKTEEGWKHTFIPDDRDKYPSHHQNFESESDISYESPLERCLICGEHREEHKKMTMKMPTSKRVVDDSMSSFESSFLAPNEEVKSAPDNRDTEIGSPDVSDDESDDEPVDPEESWVSCLICYDEHPASRMYALSCGHQFGIKCLRMMFKVGINDGKVLDNKCAYFE